MKDPQALSKKIGQVTFWIILLNLMVASFFLVYYPDALTQFLREDSIAESAGAVFLLLTGIVLLVSTFQMYKKGKATDNLVWWRIFMILGAGFLFLLAFGEEISWGQRIFQFHTPDLLEKINRQNEINLHNLDTRSFNNAVETVILLMILVPTIWMHRGKNYLLGFVLPSYWLILCLQMVAAYITYNYVKTQDYIVYLVLLYFLNVHFRSKDLGRLVYVLCAIAVIAFVGVLNANLREFHSTNGPREFREYLFAFICLIYSISIYLDVKYTYVIYEQSNEKSSTPKIDDV